MTTVFHVYQTASNLRSSCNLPLFCFFYTCNDPSLTISTVPVVNYTNSQQESWDLFFSPAPHSCTEPDSFFFFCLSFTGLSLRQIPSTALFHSTAPQSRTSCVPTKNGEPHGRVTDRLKKTRPFIAASSAYCTYCSHTVHGRSILYA
jgi:hypothetical protein